MIHGGVEIGGSFDHILNRSQICVNLLSAPLAETTAEELTSSADSGPSSKGNTQHFLNKPLLIQRDPAGLGEPQR